MPGELLTAYLKLPVFALVLTRLTGLVLLQPVLGSLAIPLRVRALLVLGLAALLTPFVSPPQAVPGTPGGLALAMAGELALGALMGLAVRMCFLGLELAGFLIATESGLAFGQIVDPGTGNEESILTTFYAQLGAAVFLIVGGHRALIEICMHTFRTVPLLGADGLLAGGVELAVDALALAGQIAIRAAAPVIVTLFLANVALGFLSRTVPQLNILTVGFSLKGLLVFALAAAALPPGFEAFTEVLEQVVDRVREFASGI